MTTETVEKSAIISPCGHYRYWLGRHWGPGGTVNFIMLNPSTADAEVDDPTIRRCVGFAKAWGYGHLVVTNLFAFRATDPKDMKAARDPIGADNNKHLLVEASEASLVLCAWGNHGKTGNRSRVVRQRLVASGLRLHCLSISKTGEPGHPLYQPGDLRPVPYGQHIVIQ